MMVVPYHVLEVCGDVVFAARGSNIYSLKSGLEQQPVLAWKYPVKEQQTEQKTETPKVQSTEEPSAESPAPEEAPPAKRRRLESGAAEAQAPEPEPEKKEGNNKSKRAYHPKKVKPQKPNAHAEKPFVQGFFATSDGRYLVTITGADKTIWVFEHDGAGNLKQLSQRAMPKRPCSLAITPDNKTILSADKFGDVYALPLIEEPGSNNKDKYVTSSTPLSRNGSTPSTPQPFKPQANELTVHTLRNLKALENQKLSQQIIANNKANEPQFEHTLILGHVSMLTDILVAKLGRREYILTADRDEHVRVSRGIPQSHIIEGFCLGHDEFISRICIPTGRPELLLSGGGDDELFLWDWVAGKVLAKAQILEHAKTVLPDLTKVAVSRIYSFQNAAGNSNWVFVICER